MIYHAVWAFMAGAITYFIFSNPYKSFSLLASLLLSILTYIFYKNASSAISALTIYTIELEIVIAILAFVFSGWAYARFEIIGSLLGKNIKYAIIARAWLLTLLITAIMMGTKSHGAPIVGDEFFNSWLVNVFFFTVTGLAAAFVSLREPSQERFSDRLGYLFAAKIDSDPDLKSSAQHSLQNKIKRDGLISSEIFRRITVVEYSKKYNAYRTYVTTEVTLINLFGDVEVDDDTLLSIQPDKFKKPNRPRIVGQIMSIQIDGEEKITNDSRKIKPTKKTTYSYSYRVGRAGVKIVTKYWMWCKVGEVSGHTPKRFSRSVSIEIVNRLKSSNKHPVRLSRISKGDKSLVTLAYNEKNIFPRMVDVNGGTRNELFCFERPSDT